MSGEDARWAGRNSDKDVLRAEVWDVLEDDGRQCRPGLEPHPEFRRRRPRRAWRSRAAPGMEDGARRQMQSRSAADSGAPARAL